MAFWMSGFMKSTSSSWWATKNMSPAAPTFTGTRTRTPFLSVATSVHIPTAVGVTVKVATYTELPAGLVAGTLTGDAVAHVELVAVMRPVYWTLIVSVCGEAAG